MRAVFIAAICILAIGLMSCGDTKDSANDVLEQEYDYEYDVDGQQIQAAGFCIPAPTLQQVVSAAGEEDWAELADHIESITVSKIEYRVPQNATDETGRVELFVSLVGDVNDATLFGATQEIVAGTAYTEWDRVNWIGDGRATLNEHFNAFRDDTDVEDAFFLCGLFNPSTANVNMTMDAVLTITITALPFT